MMQKNYLVKNKDEEVILGFTVTQKRKDVWEKELEILHYIINTCEKNSLKYWAIGGTLLGAVRHNGFIPWDDDLDIAMPREDYEKLLVLLEKDKDNPYFVQTHYTDLGFYYGHAKIRNPKTTAIRLIEWPLNLKFNQGIFVDIFPLDDVPDGDSRMECHFRREDFYRRMLQSVTSYEKRNKKSILGRCFHIFSLAVAKVFSVEQIYKKHERICKEYNGKGMKRFGMISELYRHRNRFVWEKMLFEETIKLKFEELLINVPKEYDTVLTIQYGKWQEPVMGKSMHGEVFFNTELPYTYFLGKYDEYKNSMVL